jgi:hypothetical protein
VRILENKLSDFVFVKDNVFLNKDENVLKLIFYLYFKTSPFSYFNRKSKYKILNRLPSLMKIIRVFHVIVLFVVNKKNASSSYSTVETISTKIPGQLLLKLRQGEIKVFNLKKLQVITYFPPEISESVVLQRINTVKILSQSLLTPATYRISFKERIVVEEFINNKVCEFSLNKFEEFESNLLSLLADIAKITKPINTNLFEYLNNNLSFLNGILGELLNENNSKDAKKIHQFILHIKKQLEIEKKTIDIKLVSCHGDLWEGNMLIHNNNNNKYSIIDWNTYGHRSQFFDFFYFLFMIASRNLHINGVESKGIEDLAEIIDDLYFKSQKFLSNTNTNINLYLYIFYLELIKLKLPEQNEYTEGNLSEVLTWINRFMCLEKFRGVKKIMNSEIKY